VIFEKPDKSLFISLTAVVDKTGQYNRHFIVMMKIIFQSKERELFKSKIKQLWKRKS